MYRYFCYLLVQASQISAICSTFSVTDHKHVLPICCDIFSSMFLIANTKQAKDKRFLKNWRPISLISVDAKIASKALASWMKNILSSIVKCDQTAYVKGRYIGESIRLISDILEYTEENDISGILFSADFEKAFDSIEHAFLFAVLKSFGFGPQFIHWVRTFINNVESCVVNNGHSTGYFLIRKRYQARRSFICITFHPLCRIFVHPNTRR